MTTAHYLYARVLRALENLPEQRLISNFARVYLPYGGVGYCSVGTMLPEVASVLVEPESSADLEGALRMVIADQAHDALGDEYSGYRFNITWQRIVRENDAFGLPHAAYKAGDMVTWVQDRARYKHMVRWLHKKIASERRQEERTAVADTLATVVPQKDLVLA